MILTQLVLNIRYSLMGLSLSQKLDNKFNTLHRMVTSFGITDENFAVAYSQKSPITPAYMYGMILISAAGWTLGTLLGAVMGNILPARAVGALGVALYAMFLAIILPPARKSRTIAGLVAVSMAASALLTILCTKLSLAWFTEGFRIITLTVVISAAAAILFPVQEKSTDTGAETEVSKYGE
jgi:predicted branched-subunit amino acid permease